MHLDAMQVFLDGQPLGLERPTLACALSTSVGLARARGRVIIEVKAAGSVLADELLTNPPESPVEGELHIASADPRDLVRVSLGDGVEALRELIPEQVRVAGLIHADKQQEAVAALSSIFATWMNIKDVVVRSGQLLDTDFAEIRSSDGDTVEASSRRLVGKLQDMKAALTGQDWARVADVLEYDLGEEARGWEKLLEAISLRVATMDVRLPG
jgi:hypothetical protein